MTGLPTAIVGKWLGHRGGDFSPTEGRNAGKVYPWVQIALGEEEMTLTSAPMYFSTDPAYISNANIDKEEKAYLNEKVKLTGITLIENFKPKFRVQKIELYKEK